MVGCRVVTAVHERGEIQMRNPKADASEVPKVFTYDTTYGPEATQRGIFEVTASPIVGACRGPAGWACCVCVCVGLSACAGVRHTTTSPCVRSQTRVCVG